ARQKQWAAAIALPQRQCAPPTIHDAEIPSHAAARAEKLGSAAPTKSASGADRSSASPAAPAPLRQRLLCPGQNGWRGQTLHAVPACAGSHGYAPAAAPARKWHEQYSWCWCEQCHATWNKDWTRCESS